MSYRKKKRPRRGFDGKIHSNSNSNSNNSTKCVNRTGTLFSAAVLVLATLVVYTDTIAVVAFTPVPSSTCAAVVNTNNKEIPITTTTMSSFSSTKRRRRTRQQVSLDGQGVSIMTSPIVDNNKELPVHFVLENNVVTIASNGSTRTSRLVSTTNKRNRNSKMVRPKSRNSSPRKKPQKKNSRNGVTSRSSSSSLLTREEERQITYSIRDLHRAVRIRDELSSGDEYDNDTDADDKLSTEEDWAKACGLDVLSLRRIMSKGQEARTVLVSANVGLVTSIAKRHYYALKQATDAGGGVGTILTLQDMIQEGNIGLMKAAQKFEPERGWRFSTYATYWIRQRILRSISDSSRVIRLPAHVTATLQKLNKARKEMSAEIGRVPSDPELAHYMKISVDKLRKINEKARSVVSLESPLRLGSNHKAEMDRRTIGDFIASDAPTPEEDAQRKSLQIDIRAVVNELGDREREVLILRFGLDNGEFMSTSQTAIQLGITTDRVRYVEARALNKLRSPQRNYRLKDYLGSGHRDIAEEKQEQLSSPPMTNPNSNHRRHQCQKQKQLSIQEKIWFF